MFNKVVLPLPEGPKIAANSCSLNDILTLLSAVCLKLFVLYVLLIFLSSSSYIPPNMVIYFIIIFLNVQVKY